MLTCPRCGANIDPSALACPYCHTQTQYGRQHAEHQAAYQYHAAQAGEVQRAAERHARARAIDVKSKQAMWWALGGTFTCCFPAAIIGLVMGLNAKSVAKREGTVAPGTSTAAVVIGSVAIALCTAGVIAYVIDSRATEARVVTLRAQVERQRSRNQLDQELACALVELELLQNGYAGKSGISVSDFQCDGKLEQHGEDAVLRDVRFRNGSDGKRVAAACLTRGARWSVRELREDGSCEANVSAGASAAPSSSAGP